MAKHLVDIDDENLEKARELLDTRTIKDTVNAALEEVISLQLRRNLLAQLQDRDVFDFGEDPDEFRASGWR